MNWIDWIQRSRTPKIVISILMIVLIIVNLSGGIYHVGMGAITLQHAGAYESDVTDLQVPTFVSVIAYSAPNVWLHMVPLIHILTLVLVLWLSVHCMVHALMIWNSSIEQKHVRERVIKACLLTIIVNVGSYPLGMAGIYPFGPLEWIMLLGAILTAIATPFVLRWAETADQHERDTSTFATD